MERKGGDGEGEGDEGEDEDNGQGTAKEKAEVERFQLLSSRHCVFVGAQKPVVTIETSPHHNRLPFPDLAPHYNPP